METPRYKYAEGPINNCRICFVGEAPGAEEERTGRPFVGEAGNCLSELLHNVGIIRTDCYLTNTVKERPPRNDISKFITIDGKKVTATSAFQAYREQLLDELRHCNANVIVPLGNVSLYALMGMTEITKRRGSIYACPALDGRKVIPTIHPASAIRMYIQKKFITFDLMRIKQESAYPDILMPDRLLHIEPTYMQVIEYLHRCKQAKRITFDIEVVNEEVSCISLAISPYECMSIPFVKDGYDYFNPEQELDIWLLIAGILQDPSIENNGQNLCFDGSFNLRKFGIHLEGEIHDSMVAQGIMYPDFPKGLDFITSIFTKEPYYKDEGKKWFKVGGDYRSFWIYNAKDSTTADEAEPKIVKELERLGNKEAYDRQRRLIPILIYMAERGIRIDIAGKEKASKESGDRIITMTDELHKLCGYPINPNSPAQLKEYFYVKKHIRPYVSRKTGELTVDKDALKRLSRAGHQEATILLKLRSESKLKGTYLDMKLDSDNRLRCSFNPVGTTSGRLSSSKTIFDTGGNMQNDPPQFKALMMADEGYMMYNIDLSQAENRVVAFVAGDIRMMDAFNNSQDIHRLTASLIFHKPFEEISDEDGSCSIGGGQYSERFWGKKANHGLNYDLGYKTFAFLYEIDEREAKFIVEGYHMAYPGVRQYHEMVKNQLRSNRILTNCLGKKRWFQDRMDDTLFKEAYSYIPQSTVADWMNEMGLIFTYYHPDPLFQPVEILNQVHDSMVFQIPISYGFTNHAKIIMAIKQSLEQPITWHNTSFVIPADLQAGLNLGKFDKKHPDKNPGGLKEIKSNEFKTVEELAGRIHGIYEQYRAANLVP